VQFMTMLEWIGAYAVTLLQSPTLVDSVIPKSTGTRIPL